MSLSTACPDWRQRLLDGRTLVPEMALDREEASRAARMFDRLRLPDVIGQPLIGDTVGDWYRDAVKALNGAYDIQKNTRRIATVFMMLPKKQGKALALDTQIATPAGFTAMRDIRVGDLVLGPDGKPSPVIAKSEVQIGRRCYEVEFSTGEIVVCDEEHLWETDTHLDRDRLRVKSAKSVKTTRQIAETLHFTMGANKWRNHRIEVSASLDLPDVDVPIAPYALGVWLGDGHSAGGRVTSSSDDAGEMVERLLACGQGAAISAADSRSSAVTISLAEKHGVKGYCFQTEARRLGILGNKRIPRIYLRSSANQRSQLLCGLMDSDGDITASGQATFSTSNEALAKDVAELVASLGMKPNVNRSTSRLNGRSVGDHWRIQFYPYAEDICFAMPRKAVRQKPRPDKVSRSRTRQIVAVRSVNSVPVQCIAVANESRQYLVTRSFIATHNTTLSGGTMLTQLMMNRRPNARFGILGGTQKIAEEAYDSAAGMIEADPKLQKFLKTTDHLKLIEHRLSGAYLQITTFDLKVATGGKFVGCLVDELHVLGTMAKADRVIGQIRGARVAFPESFVWFITTQSEDPPSGVFDSELKYARKVRDGEIDDPSYLPIIYEFPREFQEDKTKPWENPDCWHQVMPSLGSAVSLEVLEELFRADKEKGEAAVRRWASQHLNIEIGIALGGDSWIGAEFWPEEDRADSITLDEILARCEVVVVGIDGGGADDLLSLYVIGRERSGDSDIRYRKWLGWGHSWAFSDPVGGRGVLERRLAIEPKLNDFVADGDLTIFTNPGEEIDGVITVVQKIYDAGLLGGIGADPAGKAVAAIADALELSGMTNGAGGPIEVSSVSQGYMLQGAIGTCERELLSGRFVPAAQRIMSWALGNAKAELKGNAQMIYKQASGYAKIDPIMAMFDAVRLISLNPPPMDAGAFEIITI